MTPCPLCSTPCLPAVGNLCASCVAGMEQQRAAYNARKRQGNAQRRAELEAGKAAPPATVKLPVELKPESCACPRRLIKGVLYGAHSIDCITGQRPAVPLKATNCAAAPVRTRAQSLWKGGRN